METDTVSENIFAVIIEGLVVWFWTEHSGKKKYLLLQKLQK